MWLDLGAPKIAGQVSNPLCFHEPPALSYTMGVCKVAMKTVSGIRKLLKNTSGWEPACSSFTTKASSKQNNLEKIVYIRKQSYTYNKFP